MQIKVRINGTELMAEAGRDAVNDLRNEFVNEIIGWYVDQYDKYDCDITDEEFDKILNSLSTNVDIAKRIANGTLKTEVYDIMTKIIEERENYYELDVKFSGTFKVMVKAKSEIDARDYINNSDILIDEIEDRDWELYQAIVINHYDKKPEDWEKTIYDSNYSVWDQRN